MSEAENLSLLIDQVYADLDMPLSQQLGLLMRRLELTQDKFAIQSEIDGSVLSKILNKTEKRHLSRDQVIGIVEGIQVSGHPMPYYEIDRWRVALQCTAAAERVMSRITPRTDSIDAAHLVLARRELVSSMRLIWEETQGLLPAQMNRDDTVEIVLAWERIPRDLDLIVCAISGSTGTHIVDFRNRGSVDTAPFCQLDRDVTDGFGPETIRLRPQDGTRYEIFVHNFSAELELVSSGSTVAIRHDLGSFSFRSPMVGEGRYWHVADVEARDGQVEVLEVGSLSAHFEHLRRISESGHWHSNNES